MGKLLREMQIRIKRLNSTSMKIYLFENLRLKHSSMSQNDQTHLKNLAANATRFLKCLAIFGCYGRKD